MKKQTMFESFKAILKIPTLLRVIIRQIQEVNDRLENLDYDIESISDDIWRLSRLLPDEPPKKEEDLSKLGL